MLSQTPKEIRHRFLPEKWIPHIQPDQFADHHSCRLGKWYYQGEGGQMFPDVNTFRQLESPHHRVHENAISALELRGQNDLKATYKDLSQMEQASEEVMHLLDTLKPIYETRLTQSDKKSK